MVALREPHFTLMEKAPVAQTRGQGGLLAFARLIARESLLDEAGDAGESVYALQVLDGGGHEECRP
jgi:hypothetical protein